MEELRAFLVEPQLRSGPHRGPALDASLPKGIDGSRSLDFIGVSVGIEDRFGLVMDEEGNSAPHVQSWAR